MISSEPLLADEIRQLRNERLSDVVYSEFGCLLTFPFQKQEANEESAARVGAVHTALTKELVPKGTQIIRIDPKAIAGEWCAPSNALPSASQGASLKGYRYHRSIAASIKIEAAKIFSLLNIGGSDVREVTIDIDEVVHRNLNSRTRRTALRNILSAPGCEKAVNHKNAQMILGTCAGKAEIGFYFNRAFTAEIIKSKLAGLDVSAEAGWQESYGDESKCGAGSGAGEAAKEKAPAKAEGTSPAKPAEPAKPKDAIDAAADAAKKGVDAVEAAKKAADALKGDEAEKPKEGAAGKEKAAAKDGGAEKPKDGAAPAAKSEKTAAQERCYKSVYLKSPPEGVFGVVLSGKGELGELLMSLQDEK